MVAERSSLGVGLVVLAALLFYAFQLPGALQAVETGNGRDFASYHVAALAADAGDDPYDRQALQSHAKKAGRRAVHPYFYPPPFLMTQRPGASLAVGARSWFAVDVISTLVGFGLLCLLTRRLAWWAPVVVAAVFAGFTAVVNNHVMGQANLFVAAWVMVAAWCVDRFPRVGSVALGFACMAKMSPALFVVIALVQRRMRWVVGACLSAILVSVVSLAWVPPAVQVRFYTEVLPGFSTGNYNGLTIPITLFGNHSLPNLWAQLWPASRGLSASAQWASRASLVIVLGSMVWMFRQPSATGWIRACRGATIAVGMLLIPVYTYEHHLIWSIPGCALGLIGIGSGRIDRRWAPWIVVAVCLLAFDLQTLKQWSKSAGAGRWWIQEAKCMGLMVLFAVLLWSGRTRPLVQPSERVGASM